MTIDHEAKTLWLVKLLTPDGPNLKDKQGRSQEGGFGGASRTPLSTKTMYVNLYVCYYVGHTPLKKKDPPFLRTWLATGLISDLPHSFNWYM